MRREASILPQLLSFLVEIYVPWYSQGQIGHTQMGEEWLVSTFYFFFDNNPLSISNIALILDTPAGGQIDRVGIKRSRITQLY